MNLQKSPAFRNSKLLKAAEGRDCIIRIPGVCNFNPATSVWCHLNGLEWGKGCSLKSGDLMGFIGCSACHDEYDGRTHKLGLAHSELQSMAEHAALLSLNLMAREGVI